MEINLVLQDRPIVFSGKGFLSAKYNEDKVAVGVAELMLMENVSERLRHTVETMHRFGLDAGAEVEWYLKDCSQTYGNTKTPGFSSTSRPPSRDVSCRLRN